MEEFQRGFERISKRCSGHSWRFRRLLGVPEALEDFTGVLVRSRGITQFQRCFTTSIDFKGLKVFQRDFTAVTLRFREIAGGLKEVLLDLRGFTSFQVIASQTFPGGS